MATTNNVQSLNFPPVSTANNFNQLWRLTRVLKKAGWKYKASGDGTSKESAGDPAGDLWGAGTISLAGGAGASIVAPARGRAQINGLAGITAAHKGQFLAISGSGTAANNHYHQIEEIVSATSVKIDARTFAVAADAGPLTWEIRDPLGNVYPTALDSVAAWWCAQGPSTLKIPITAAPVVGAGGYTFIRGENVVQATTGAEGEILGVVFDGVSAGWLVIAPRLRGTGAGIYGWDTGRVVTGAISGATVSQVGTALEYRWEMVLWKGTNQTQGSMFFGVCEPVAEGAANLFSALSAAAGCTAVVAPGGGGVSNTFPTYAWVAQGTTSSGGHTDWDGFSSATTIGFAQIMCADLIEEQGYSADGSWVLAYPRVETVGIPHVGFTFQKCEDQEDGDLAPYVSTSPWGVTTLYGNARTSAGTTPNSSSYNTDDFSITSHGVAGTVAVSIRTWRKRGMALGDAFQELEAATLNTAQIAVAVLSANPGDSDKVAAYLTTVRVREPIWVVSTSYGKKIRKGTLKWVSAVQGGSSLNLYDAKLYVQLSSQLGAFVAGPWDGVTDPIAT
jgi:hypothetical protein